MNSLLTAGAASRPCRGCLQVRSKMTLARRAVGGTMATTAVSAVVPAQRDGDRSAMASGAVVAPSAGKAAASSATSATPANAASTATTAAGEAGVGSFDTHKQSWEPVQSFSLKSLAGIYARLTKLKLSGLVVLTTMGGYALAPSPLPFDWAGLGVVSLGTAFCVASANSLNQWIEIPYDAQMKRTCDRPLVRGDMSPFHAFSVAVASGAVGVGMLSTINPIVASLGLFNIFLYAGVYTPMKRHSIYNTWAGSVVGAIPPLMGWAAATGTLSAPGYVLAGVLFAWQFPHFNALSWKLRPDYSKAGYRMMSVIDPALCKAVALRYSAALIPISLCAPALGLTDWTFVLDSTLVNGYITHKAYQFYAQGDDASARKLFLTSLWHLPAIMGLLLVHSHFA